MDDPMTTNGLTEPADTQMMGIVHDALRRDLCRSRAVLVAEAPPPSAAQQRALAEHMTWMMQFLHSHHHGEDAGMYPAVRARNTDAIALIDVMEAQHQAVVPAIARVDAAARDYRAGDGTGERVRLLASIDDLEAVLLPHLRQEEDEMMPIVSAALTGAELAEIDHQYFVKPKSFRELGHEGHWLIDGLDPERRHVVTRAVPAVPRFILLHGFARGYRRRAAACWGQTRPARRAQTAGRVEVTVDAPPAAVWDVVRDVTRVGEWSHECTSVVWLDGATEAHPGVRFQGHNHASIFRWGRVCEIVTSEPWELTWRTVPSRFYPDTTTWTIRLHETPDGRTRIEQSFQGAGPKLLLRAYGIVIPAHRDRTEALADDLRRLGNIAAGVPLSPTNDGARS